jgi:hypothetical protein
MDTTLPESDIHLLDLKLPHNDDRLAWDFNIHFDERPIASQAKQLSERMRRAFFFAPDLNRLQASTQQQVAFRVDAPIHALNDRHGGLLYCTVPSVAL